MERRNARVHLGDACRKFHRESDRGDHAVGPRDSLVSDGESGAVIGAGAREGKAESDVHSFMESVEFQRDQALIVIHAKHGVEFSLHGAVENSIG